MTWFKKIILVLLVVLIFGAVPAEAGSGINRKINFQGKVVNKGVGGTDGTNVTDGNYDFKFTLWDALSAGTTLWTETWSGGSQVAVSSGIFNVALGTYVSFPATANFNSDSLFLSVNFKGDGDMSPRMQMTAVPYAFNAEKVMGLTVTATTGILSIGNSKTITFGDNFTTTGVGISLDQSLATTNNVIFAGLSIGGSANVTSNLSVGGSVAFTNIPVSVGTTVLFIDATGKLTQGFMSSGVGTTYVALNGLSMVGTNTLGLGGTLSQNTSLNLSSYGLSFLGLGGTQSLFMSSSGNVGIGTTNPGAILEIAPPSAPDQWIRIDSVGTHGDIAGDYGLRLRTNGFSNYANHGYISFETSGTSGATSERMRIDKDGNVGIGTTSPNYKLDVNGTTNITGAATITAGNTTALNLYSGNAAQYTGFLMGRTVQEGIFSIAAASGQISDFSTAGDFILRSDTADLILTAKNATGAIRFGTGAADTENMTILSGGNVGIGTTAPTEKLDVSGNINTNGHLNIWGKVSMSNSGTVLEINNNSYFTTLGFFTSIGGGAATEKMRIDTNGNVGIGTTNPTQPLTVFGPTHLPGTSGTTQYASLRLMAKSNSNSIDFGAYGGDGSGWIQVTNTNDLATSYNLLLNPNGGKVGIGTTNPLYKLTISDNSTTYANTIYQGNASGYGQYMWVNNNSATIDALRIDGSVGIGLLDVKTNGNVGIGTTGPAARLAVQTTGTTDILNLFETGGTEVFTVLESGNVGIGTTNPAYKLQVVGDAMFGNRLGIGATGTRAFNVSTDASIGTNLSIGGSVTLTALPVGVGSSVIYISANGNLVAGTLPPSSSSYSKVIVLSPEFAGASLSKDGSVINNGSMTSDSTLNSSGIGWKNYYEWVSTAATLQDYSVLVRVTLPSDFNTWETGTCPGATCALEMTYQTGLGTTGDNYVSFLVNSDIDTPATAVCTIGSVANTSWGSSGCTEAILNDGSAPQWNAAGETAVIRIKMGANNTASAVSRVGDIVLRYKSKF